MTKIDTKEMKERYLLREPNKILSIGESLEVAHLCDAYDEAQKEIEDLKEVIEDKRRLTREIDIALNGENAAPQASLCDILSYLKHRKPHIVAFGSHEEYEKFKQDLDNKKDSRISTLETLLRECLKHKDSGTETDRYGETWPICIDCESVEIKANDGGLRHKSDCLFTRIQKELGE